MIPAESLEREILAHLVRRTPTVGPIIDGPDTGRIRSIRYISTSPVRENRVLGAGSDAGALPSIIDLTAHRELRSQVGRTVTEGALAREVAMSSEPRQRPAGEPQSVSHSDLLGVLNASRDYSERLTRELREEAREQRSEILDAIERGRAELLAQMRSDRTELSADIKDLRQRTDENSDQIKRVITIAVTILGALAAAGAVASIIQVFQ